MLIFESAGILAEQYIEVTRSNHVWLSKPADPEAVLQKFDTKSMKMALETKKEEKLVHWLIYRHDGGGKMSCISLQNLWEIHHRTIYFEMPVDGKEKQSEIWQKYLDTPSDWNRLNELNAAIFGYAKHWSEILRHLTALVKADVLREVGKLAEKEIFPMLQPNIASKQLLDITKEHIERVAAVNKVVAESLESNPSAQVQVRPLVPIQLPILQGRTDEDGKDINDVWFPKAEFMSLHYALKLR